jgi:hypothetical protein
MKIKEMNSFWKAKSCNFARYNCFYGNYCLSLQDKIKGADTLHSIHTVFLRSLSRLLVRANVVPGSPISVILMTEAIYSSETSVLTRATWRNIPEDGILHISKTFTVSYRTTDVASENTAVLMNYSRSN